MRSSRACSASIPGALSGPPMTSEGASGLSKVRLRFRPASATWIPSAAELSRLT